MLTLFLLLRPRWVRAPRCCRSWPGSSWHPPGSPGTKPVSRHRQLERTDQWSPPSTIPRENTGTLSELITLGEPVLRFRFLLRNIWQLSIRVWASEYGAVRILFYTACISDGTVVHIGTTRTIYSYVTNVHPRYKILIRAPARPGIPRK